jgi:hypothetical protein
MLQTHVQDHRQRLDVQGLEFVVRVAGRHGRHVVSAKLCACYAGARGCAGDLLTCDLSKAGIVAFCGLVVFH